MAYSFDGSLDMVAEALAKHSKVAICDAIKRQLQAEADKIVEEAAKQMADGVVAQLERFTDHMSGQINLVLRVNNKEVAR